MLGAQLYLQSQGSGGCSDFPEFFAEWDIEYVCYLSCGDRKAHLNTFDISTILTCVPGPSESMQETVVRNSCEDNIRKQSKQTDQEASSALLLGTCLVIPIAFAEISVDLCSRKVIIVIDR